MQQNACGRNIFLRSGSQGFTNKNTEHLAKFEIQINTHYVFFCACMSLKLLKKFTFTKRVFIHGLSEI